MRLIDLHPVFLDHGGEGVTMNGQPVPRQEGVGIQLDCPCGCEHRLYVPFDVALDGQPAPDGAAGWKRTGTTFETLTLSPSILRNKDGRSNDCPKRWHGFIEAGNIRTV